MHMSYEEFKDTVVKRFLDYMPEDYKGMKLEVHSVTKINETLDGITLKRPDVLVSPTLYINDMYRHYLDIKNLDDILQDVANSMVNALNGLPDIPDDSKFDRKHAKESIIFQLINTEQNKQLIKDIPSRQFQDLSIIYRWILRVEDEGVMSSVINQDLTEMLDLSEEKLFQLAIKNTRQVFPPTVKSIDEVMKSIFEDNDDSMEMSSLVEYIPPERMLWVISNENLLYGATTMLYEDVLYSLAEKIGTDLYILPSSLHECIAVSTSAGDPCELAQMVAEINAEQVATKDRLSNQVYHYNKELRKITLATDTPNKGLTADIRNNI